jgi:hypothetical protein
MASISELIRQVNGLYDVTTDVNKVDPFNQTVQFEDDSNFVASADTSFIFSGPPVFKKGATSLDAWANYLVPIGAMQNFSDNEQNGVQPFGEIGSRLKRTSRGQANYQLSLSRVVTFHSNMRHALYAWIAKMFPNTPIDFRVKPGDDSPSGQPGVSVPSTHFNSMESDLYGLPTGMLLVTVGAGGVLISKDYYERCHILTAGKALNAGGPIIQEGVQLFVTRKVPAVGLKINMDTLNELAGQFTIVNPAPNFAP